MRAHRSGRAGFGWLGGSGGGAMAHMRSPKCGLHAVSDPAGQFVGPLVHGLVGHAHRISGSLDGAAEQLDGFGFVHVPHLTIVHNLSSSAARHHSTMVVYSDRLKAALERAGVKTQALATALGVSYQAVKKVLDGGSRAFTAENNAKAARFLNVPADWLATGDGSMLQPSLPRDFSDRREVSASDWGLLQDVQLVMSDEELASIRARAERTRRVAQVQQVSASVPRPDTGQRRRQSDRDQFQGGMSGFGGLDELHEPKSGSR